MFNNEDEDFTENGLEDDNEELITPQEVND
jgi:hypothetical protein